MLRLRSSSLRSSLLSSVIRKGRVESTSTILIRSFARRRNNSDYIDTKLESKQVPVQYKPAIQPDEDKPTEFTIDPINRVETLQALDPDDLDEENADLPDSQVDVGRRLLTLSNSHYRRVTHLPNWLENKKKDMTENRTLAQIRRCLKSWMVKTDISEMKSYLNRPLHYNTAKKPTDPKPNRTTKYLYGPEETTAYVYYHMPERYTITTHLLEDLKMYTNKGFTPKKVLDYGCGPATVAASLATVWPEASKEMSYAGVEISRSMIDAANIMIQDIMPNATFWTKTSEIIGRCLEKNERYDLIVCSYTLSEFHNDETRRVATQMLYELLEPNGYLLFIENGNPIGSHIVRTARQYLLHLSSTVDKKGNFELYQEAVEEEEKKKPRKEIDEDDEKDDEEEEKEEDDEDSLSGEDLKGNETLRQRVQKIAKSNKKEEPLKPLMMILPPPKTYVYTDLKAKIIAPCTHDGLCPLKKDQWCSFAQKVFSGTIRKDSEEKYSYVMLQKVVNPSRENNKIKTASELSRAQWLKKEEVDDLKKPLTKQMIETLRPLQILNRFIDITEKRDEKQALRMLDILDQTNWDNYHPNNVRYEYARILRSPMKERGHVVFDLCLPSGEVTRYNHSKATLKYFPHLYRAVRKTSWGGLFPAFMKKQIEKKVQKHEEIRIRSDEDLERFLRSSRQYGDEEDDDDDESMFERRGRRSSKRGRRTADDGDDDRAFDQLLQSLDVAKKEPNKFGSNGKGGRNTAPRQNAEYRVMEDREVDRNRDLVSRNSPKEDEEEEEEVREPVRGRRRRSSILKNREN